jgi:hypothetical protein
MNNTDADTLWGVPAIAPVINRTRRQTYRLLENKQIPARKVGDHWVASRKRLLAFLHEEEG